jgi:hypothetical protein
MEKGTDHVYFVQNAFLEASIRHYHWTTVNASMASYRLIRSNS